MRKPNKLSHFNYSIFGTLLCINGMRGACVGSRDYGQNTAVNTSPGYVWFNVVFAILVTDPAPFAMVLNGYDEFAKLS